ncbi:hypothetical protein MUK42_32600 [Musa troglodytarum]|uniref:Uncharacterized protein n=1 Tax=Musa troglodytarum TaxID=320322 RepID=A0A9E7JP63_9LILI|nr:hypothetical protein MUK42_32600 [Musa troglodytarum]
MCCISNVFGKKKNFEGEVYLFSYINRINNFGWFFYSSILNLDLNEFYDEAKLYDARNLDCKMFIN